MTSSWNESPARPSRVFVWSLCTCCGGFPAAGWISACLGPGCKDWEVGVHGLSSRYRLYSGLTNAVDDQRLVNMEPISDCVGGGQVGGVVFCGRKKQSFIFM